MVPSFRSESPPPSESPYRSPSTNSAGHCRAKPLDVQLEIDIESFLPRFQLQIQGILYSRLDPD